MAGAIQWMKGVKAGNISVGGSIAVDVYKRQLLHGIGGPGGIALGALDGDEPGLFVDGGPDAVIVEPAVRQQVHLPVRNAVLLQGAGGGPDADDLLQSVIGSAHRAEQLVPGQQVGPQGQGQGMGCLLYTSRCV